MADRTELQVSYAIGMARPISISLETFATNKVSDDVIAQLIEKHFDLRPGAIIRDLNLRAPIYRQTATYGHFGRDDLDLPWERTDKAPLLRREALLALSGPTHVPMDIDDPPVAFQTKDLRLQESTLSKYRTVAPSPNVQSVVCGVMGQA